MQYLSPFQGFYRWKTCKFLVVSSKCSRKAITSVTHRLYLSPFQGFYKWKTCRFCFWLFYLIFLESARSVDIDCYNQCSRKAITSVADRHYLRFFQGFYRWETCRFFSFNFFIWLISKVLVPTILAVITSVADRRYLSPFQGFYKWKASRFVFWLFYLFFGKVHDLSILTVITSVPEKL